MKLGLYRTVDPLLGEAARVHNSAGDAAPYLSRYLYDLLDFAPAFDTLPSASEFERLPRARMSTRAGAKVGASLR